MSKPRHRRARAVHGMRAHAVRAFKKQRQRRFASFRRRRIEIIEQELDQEMQS